MIDATSSSALPARPGWLARGEAWLDARGKAAWIVATIAGFILFWPLGLALLAYMIWSKRMFGCSHSARKSWAPAGFAAMKPSGNAAFDAYKSDTLRRLEQEQKDFEAFLKRLREARDKAEFDQFMADRARKEDTAPEPGERD